MYLAFQYNKEELTTTTVRSTLQQNNQENLVRENVTRQLTDAEGDNSLPNKCPYMIQKEDLAEECTTQEDLLNSIIETSNIFEKVPSYYDKLKTICFLDSIQYFSCERTISTKLDLQAVDYKADGVAKFLKRSNQIPVFLLEVLEDPSKLDLDKFSDDRQKLMKKGVFTLNKFMMRTNLPTWKYITGDKLKIGQMVYISPDLYLYFPFTVLNLLVLTSLDNLEHTPRLIWTLLCLRYNVIKKIEMFKKFEREEQQYIIKSTTKVMTFAEFLPNVSKEETNKQGNTTRGRGRGRGQDQGRGMALQLIHVQALPVLCIIDLTMCLENYTLDQMCSIISVEILKLGMEKLGSDIIKSFYHEANIKNENLEKIGAWIDSKSKE
ncbi:hypothetical protein C1645_731408 [Glomus cerebriforme]|uniref:Uncharacterized protein n=1 Tax=Glomus cerebriforme TaxID=658196 RepID=A0A397TN41_9GLOM|nr:hypothetical protein C1645_731408 [Glomus cerebriforme]